MSAFNVKTTPIEDLLIIRPAVNGETREYLTDINSDFDYSAMGLEENFIEQVSELAPRGTLRGLHFQSKNTPSRLVGVTEGRALVVAVDLRPESKTFGGSHSVELNAENEALLYVPAYFALGYLTLDRNTEVYCNYSMPHSEEAESGMVWDDEILAINWQLERYEIDEKRLIISQRDKRLPSFRSYNPNALWINRPKKSRYALRKPFVWKNDPA